MWTEILTEDICVTHVDGYHVVTPLSSDVSRDDVRWVFDYLERRAAIRQENERMRKIATDIRRQQQVAAKLGGTEYEGLI